jgi:PAS domain S-box-containing protein
LRSTHHLLAQALWDEDGRVLNANDAYLELVGCKRDELLRGQLFWDDVTPSHYADLDRRALDEIKKAGRCTPFEKEIWRRDGVRIPVLVHAALVDDARSCVISYMVDLRGRSLAGSSRTVGGAPRKQPPLIIVGTGKRRNCASSSKRSRRPSLPSSFKVKLERARKCSPR